MHGGRSVGGMGSNLRSAISTIQLYAGASPTPIILLMLACLIIAALLAISTPMQCGSGVPVLTRIPRPPGDYTVEFQCYCPADYFGIQCRSHRKLSCYLQTKEWSPSAVDSSNYQERQ